MAVSITPVDANRFLSRVTRWIVAVVGVMALAFYVALLVAPRLDPAWRRALSPWLGFGLVAALIGLLILIAVLRRGMVNMIRGLTSQQEALTARNHDLEAQADANRALTDELRHTTRRLGVAQHVAKLGYWE